MSNVSETQLDKYSENQLFTTSYPTNPMPIWVIRHLDIFYGSIALYILTFGLTCNAITLGFFMQAKIDLVKKIYIMITTIDLITCLLMLPIAISNFDHRNAHLFAQKFLCNAHGFLWNVSARLTVYLVMILSITRTIYLIFPFKKISQRNVLLSVAIYMLIQLGQASLPFAVSSNIAGVGI